MVEVVEKSGGSIEDGNKAIPYYERMEITMTVKKIGKHQYEFDITNPEEFARLLPDTMLIDLEAGEASDFKEEKLVRFADIEIGKWYLMM